jgi:nitroreductase
VDVIEAMITRRSVRAFLPDKVPGAVIEEILGAAMHAPSAGDEQPWHVVVIDDRTLLAQVPAINPSADFADKAPCGLLVCGDTSLDRFGGFWAADCAALTQNILLAAHAHGLGAVWTGVHPIEQRVAQMKRLLSLPAGIVPYSLVLLGKPARRLVPSEDRFRKERVHRNLAW